MGRGGVCVCVCVWKRVLSAMAELHSCQRDPQAGLWSGCPGHGEGLPFRRASLTQEGGRVQERRAWPCGLHLAQHQQRVSRRLGMLSILAQPRAPPGSRLTKHHLILQTLSSTELHPTASCGLLACVVSAGLSPPPLIPVSSRAWWMGSFNTLAFSYCVCDAKAAKAIPWQRQQ